MKPEAGGLKTTLGYRVSPCFKYKSKQTATEWKNGKHTVEMLPPNSSKFQLPGISWSMIPPEFLILLLFSIKAKIMQV